LIMLLENYNHPYY